MTIRFHWVRCQLDTINKCITEKSIEFALTTLPKDINGTYERILLKIVGEGEETAKTAEKILMWLVGAERPLTLWELEEAMIIEPGMVELNPSSRLIDSSDILTICGSLVEEFLDKSGRQIVRLSHYTVRVSMSPGALLETGLNDSVPFFSGISSAWDHPAASNAGTIPFPSGWRTYETHNVFGNLLAVRHI